jgi:sodium transport system ATP-binding protein
MSSINGQVSGETRVEALDLRKVFHDEGRGRIVAVDGLGFAARKGEVLGLLGANGAGKTTTLRMLSTVIAPTSGAARVMGYDVVSESAEARRNLGFYSASTALYPRMTARETIAFFASINHYPENRLEERIRQLIERFSLGAYADARVEKLSSGMKQKVSIARTLAHDPPVLIFDEPTVGLDVLNAIEVHEQIKILRSEGKTILFSTHIMSEAEKLCDRIAIVHKGRLIECGTLPELRERSGRHYLEDIFIWFVTRTGPAESGA